MLESVRNLTLRVLMFSNGNLEKNGREPMRNQALRVRLSAIRRARRRHRTVNSVMAEDTAQDPEADRGDANDNPDSQQNRRNHSQDAPGVRQGPAARVHRAGIHLLEVAAAHDPSRDAKRRADHETEDAKDENQSAMVWFHSRG